MPVAAAIDRARVVRASARRLDWRFVLPPQPDGVLPSVLLVGDADGSMTAQVRESGVAKEVTGPAEGRAVDAAVVLSSDVSDVLSATQALGPGGVLYCEIDRRSVPGWTPRRLRRHLEAHGFATAVYWRWRKDGRDTVWLPLDAPGAVPWFLRELMDTRGRVRRTIQRAALRALRGDGGRIAPLVRRYSLVAVLPEPEPGSTRPPLTPSVLRDGGEEDELPLVLARGEGSWSRVVLLPFTASGRRPRVVVKLPRTVEHNHATEREQGILRELSEILPEELARTVPTPRGLRRWHGLAVGSEEFLPGRPVAFAAAPVVDERLEGDPLQAAVGWLVNFHRATQEDLVPTHAERAARLVDGPVLGALAVLGIEGWHGAEGLAAQLSVRSVTAASVPVVREHGDLTPRNLRRAGDRHSVVDWESSRRGPAVCDLLYLLLHWRWPTMPAFAADPQGVFRALFMTPHSTPAKIASAQVQHYCRALGVDPRLTRPLLRTMLAQQALDRAARIRDSGQDPTHDSNLYGDLLQLVLGTTSPVPDWNAVGE